MTSGASRDDVATLPALMEEAIVRPDDNAVRSVLADLLQATGDPRGELMALQLLPADDGEARARQDRIHDLVQRHARELLGPLREIACGARFDRGFLQALELASEWPADDKRFDAVLLEPALRTVEELLPGTVEGAVYARFVRSATLRSLRRIEVYDEESLRAFELGALPIEHVACRIDWADARLIDDHLVPACRARESLISMTTSAPMFDRLVGHTWFGRLRSVGVACGARRGLALWPRLHPGQSLTIVSNPGLEPCSRAFPWDYRIQLVRTPDGIVARVAGEWLLQSLGALGALPRDVIRIEIEHTSDAMARRVHDVVARSGVDIVVCPPRRAGSLTWGRRLSAPHPS